MIFSNHVQDLVCSGPPCGFPACSAASVGLCFSAATAGAKTRVGEAAAECRKRVGEREVAQGLLVCLLVPSQGGKKKRVPPGRAFCRTSPRSKWNVFSPWRGSNPQPFP